MQASAFGAEFLKTVTYVCPPRAKLLFGVLHFLRSLCCRQRWNLKLPIIWYRFVLSPLIASLSRFRFLETGYRSDFNKIRMKLSEMASVQLQTLVRKSRQLRDSIQQDMMKEDCVYVSDYEDRNFMNFFGGDPFEYGRRIEVVTLD